MLVLAALLFALLSLLWFPKVVGPVVAALSALVAFGAGILASASAVVLARYKRSSLGKRDLFLELNRSRDAAAIKSGAVARISRVRRWLAQRLLGHDLLVGDLVEVKSWTEIRATLDEQGCLEHLPFMPEMLAMCGRRAHVFRCMHRLFDYRKTRRMRHMDGSVLLVGTVCNGSNHGGCEAACHTIWKAAWLRRVDRPEDSADAAALDAPQPVKDAAVLEFGTQGPRYACQLTHLHAASRPISKWRATNFLLPLITGNVAPAAFAVGWLTYLFNELQHHRQGVSFPAFEAAVGSGGKREEARLEQGDQVVVRSSAEIRATLNEHFMNRGLWFEPDMLKHCGRRYCVQAEVEESHRYRHRRNADDEDARLRSARRPLLGRATALQRPIRAVVLARSMATAGWRLIPKRRTRKGPA